MNTSDAVDTCLANRALTAQLISRVLVEQNGKTEQEVYKALRAALATEERFHDGGWYNPPPDGIGVLFADARDHFERSKFPTLRTEPYWPSTDYTLKPDSVGMVYVSPIDIKTGVISDIGFNFYRGNDPKVQVHLRRCLETIEAIAELAEVGMPFNVLHAKAQKVLDKHGVNNDWMQTYNDPARGANFGHTFPWTYEAPTTEEQAVIDTKEFTKLKSVIERKRLFINGIEEFSIPPTIAFSVEARLGSNNDPTLPGGYY